MTEHVPVQRREALRIAIFALRKEAQTHRAAADKMTAKSAGRTRATTNAIEHRHEQADAAQAAERHLGAMLAVLEQEQPASPFELAQSEYHAAARRFADALRAEVSRIVIEHVQVPVASLKAYVDVSENAYKSGGIVMRAVSVHDADGVCVADEEHFPGDIEADSEEYHWQALADEIDPLLDWLADLDGLDFGTHELDVVA